MPPLFFIRITLIMYQFPLLPSYLSGGLSFTIPFLGCFLNISRSDTSPEHYITYILTYTLLFIHIFITGFITRYRERLPYFGTRYLIGLIGLIISNTYQKLIFYSTELDKVGFNDKDHYQWDYNFRFQRLSLYWQHYFSSVALHLRPHLSWSPVPGNGPSLRLLCIR